MIRKYLDRLFNLPQRRQSAAAKVAALSDIGKLDRAIKIVAAAMPEFAPGPESVNSSGASPEDVIHALINGSSLILSCDFEIHPTHAIMAIPQPNGRLRLSIVRRDSFFTEGRL